MPPPSPTSSGSFSTGIIIGTVAFLIGTLFMSMIYEIPVLFYDQAPTDAQFLALEQYYATLWTAPLAVKALLHVMLVAPLFALAVKIASYTEAAIYFDGVCAVIMILIVSFYTSSTVPNLRLLASTPSTPSLVALIEASTTSPTSTATTYDPSSPFAFLSRFFRLLSYPSSLMSAGRAAEAAEAFKQLLKDDPVTPERRIDILKVTAAGHTLAMVLLVMVLVLQAGRVYAENEDAKNVAAAAKAEAAAALAERKAQ